MMLKQTLHLFNVSFLMLKQKLGDNKTITLHRRKLIKLLIHIPNISDTKMASNNAIHIVKACV